MNLLWKEQAQINEECRKLNNMKEDAVKAAEQKSFYRLPRRIAEGKRFELKLTYIIKLFIGEAQNLLDKKVDIFFDQATDEAGADFVINAESRHTNVQVKLCDNLDNVDFKNRSLKKYHGKDIKVLFLNNSDYNVTAMLNKFFEGFLTPAEINKVWKASSYFRMNAVTVWKL